MHITHTSGPDQVYPPFPRSNLFQERPFLRPCPCQSQSPSPPVVSEPGRSRLSLPSPLLSVTAEKRGLRPSEARVQTEPLLLPAGGAVGRRDGRVPPARGLASHPRGGWRWVSGGCGLGSGRSGCPPRRRGAWASPGPRPRLGVSALAMAGPARVRAPRGPGSGRGRDRGLRVRRRGDPNKAGSARRSPAPPTAAASQPSLTIAANAFGVGVSEGLQWCPAGFTRS